MKSTSFTIIYKVLCSNTALGDRLPPLQSLIGMAYKLFCETEIRVNIKQPPCSHLIPPFVLEFAVELRARDAVCTGVCETIRRKYFTHTKLIIDKELSDFPVALV